MASRAEYLRRLRDAAELRGLCRTCRKHPRRPDLRTCVGCGDRDKRLEGLTRQQLWRECCQSTDDHRFDCTAVPPEQRGKGPFLPTRLPTADLVAALRRVA